jgi:dTDP-4-dehydrorhamnose reductase
MAAVKALVIGASGLVGGALLRALAAARHDAVGTYRARPAPGLRQLDVADASAARGLIAELRPDVVFLTAALTAVDYCEDHEDEARRINVDGPRAVGQAASAAGARVVYYSTEYVFDGVAGPYSEDDPISPQGAYARSKADGEWAVRQTNLDHLILRTTVVFGWDRASKNFAMQVWERLSAGQRMRVPCDQVGNPTLVEFLAETSVDLVAGGVSGQTVNVVGLDRVPRTEFAVRLARRLGLDESLIDPIATPELHQRAPRPLNAGLKTDKLARLVGRSPLGLDEALDRFTARKALPG